MDGLFVSDLHLTDRPEDEYRWALFPQLRDLSNEHGITDLYLLGDLTEHKDYHSSRLVNRLVDALYWLRRHSRIAEVHVLKGNHDGLDPTRPYFLFLRRIPWCKFYHEPTWVDKGKDTLLFLPHTRNALEDWKEIELGNASHIFIHGSVKGAVSESGMQLDGIPVDLFKGLRACILAGDIHVPQTVGRCVEYVGAPYPIRFGDTFEPRALWLKGNKRISLPLKNIRKLTITVNAMTLGDEFDTIQRGDQVKVIIELRDSELGDFHGIKKAVSETVDLCGGELLKVQLVRKASGKPRIKTKQPSKATSPVEELEVFCKRNKVDESLSELGELLLKEYE